MDELSEMQAWFAVHKVLMRYCRGIDRCDIPLLLSAFHPDATIHYFDGLTGNAWEHFSKFSPERYSVRCPQRTISNLIVDFDGDIAYSEAYAVAYYMTERNGDGLEFVVWGVRYIDRLERRSDVLRISDRKVVHDWDTALPVNHAYPEHGDWMRGRLTGKSDKTDPSYGRPPMHLV